METVASSENSKRIVALVGSPRKGGNTDTLVTEMLSAARMEGAAAEKIYLLDHVIHPCLMCGTCRRDNHPPCVQDDDFNTILKKIQSADVIILATPVYWGNVSGMMKIFMERGYSLFDHEWKHSKIAGKSAALVVCYGGGEVANQTAPVFFSLEMFLDYSRIRVVDKIIAMADTRGEIAKNAEAMAKAADAGKKLAGYS